MLSIGDLLAATGGSVLRPGGLTQIESAEIDASRVRPGDTYIAIDPKKYSCSDGGFGLTGNEDSAFGLGGYENGHDRISEAIKHGATAVVLENEVDLDSIPSYVAVLRCPRAVEAVRVLAQERLRDRGVRVIGVSGCIGKSTVCHLIWSCLNNLEKGSALLCDRTRTTYLGLSIDILRYVNGQKYLVVELQSDGIGQIPSLIRVAHPDISVVSRITNAHLVKLGTIQDIIAEETSPIFDLKPGRRPVVVLNGDDENLASLSSSTWDKRILVGYSGHCDMRIEDVRVRGLHTHCRLEYGGNQAGIDIPWVGSHSPFSAAVTASVACELGHTLLMATRAISECPPPPGRIELFRGRNDWKVLVDAYNAGLESTLNAVDTLNSIRGGKRVGIIGSMLELGCRCRSEHEVLGQHLTHKLDVLITVGEAAFLAFKSAIDNGFPKQDAFHFESVERLILSLDDLHFPRGSRIVVKGSGAMRLERVALHLLRERIS